MYVLIVIFSEKFLIYMVELRSKIFLKSRENESKCLGELLFQVYSRRNCDFNLTSFHKGKKMLVILPISSFIFLYQC